MLFDTGGDQVCHLQRLRSKGHKICRTSAIIFLMLSCPSIVWTALADVIQECIPIGEYQKIQDDALSAFNLERLVTSAGKTRIGIPDGAGVELNIKGKTSKNTISVTIRLPGGYEIVDQISNQFLVEAELSGSYEQNLTLNSLTTVKIFGARYQIKVSMEAVYTCQDEPCKGKMIKSARTDVKIETPEISSTNCRCGAPICQK